MLNTNNYAIFNVTIVISGSREIKLACNDERNQKYRSFHCSRIFEKSRLHSDHDNYKRHFRKRIETIKNTDKLLLYLIEKTKNNNHNLRTFYCKHLNS